MDLEIIKHLARGSIPPGVFALIVFAVLWWRGGRKPDPAGSTPAAGNAGPGDRVRLLLTPILFAIGYIPTHIIVLRASWPPASAADWLPVIAGVVAAASLLLVLPRVPAALAWIAIAIVLLGIGWVSAAGVVRQSWTTGQTTAHLAGFAAVTLAAAWAAAQLTRGATGPAPALLVMLPVGAASQLLVLAYYSLRLGQAAGVVTAMIGGVLVIAVWKRRLVLGSAGAVWTVVLAMTCLFQGTLYGDAKVPMLYPPLVAASPIAALMVRRLAGSKLGFTKRTLAELAAAALPVAAAMAVAIASRPPAEE